MGQALMKSPNIPLSLTSGSPVTTAHIIKLLEVESWRTAYPLPSHIPFLAKDPNAFQSIHLLSTHLQKACCPPSWKPSLQMRLNSCPLLLPNPTCEGFSVHLVISFSVFCWTAVFFLPFFFWLKHTPLHIQDGLSTALALFSTFCPSQSRREVKKTGARKRVGWGPLAAVVCKKRSRSRLHLAKSGWVGIC